MLPIFAVWCCATLSLYFSPTLAYSHLFGKPPQAVIHLPENVFKAKDRVQINHHALSDYLSGLKDIPSTLHEHGRILAQLDHSQLAQHLGQSVSSGRLPLISVTSPADQSASASPPKVAYELQGDGYASPYQGPQMLTGSGGSKTAPADAGYSMPAAPSPNTGYDSAAPQSAGPAQPNYGGPSGEYYDVQPQQPPQQSAPSGYYGSNDAGGYSGNDNSNNYAGNAPASNGYGSGELSGNSYGGNSNNNNGYAIEGAGGYELMGTNGDSNSIAEYGRSYAGESSPFDFNFVQDILGRVLQQLEQQQITPEQLQAYGEPEEPARSNDYGNSNNQYQPDSYGGQQQPAQQAQQSYGQQQSPMRNAHTVAFRVPTIRYELPDAQIDQLMHAISGGSGSSMQQYGSGSQPVPLLVPAGRLRLSTPMGMGSVRTIAVIKSARLPTIKKTPQMSAFAAADGANAARLMYAASVPSALRVRHVFKKSSITSGLGHKRSLSPSSSLAMATAAVNRKLIKKSSAKPCDEDKKAKKKK